MKHKFFYLLLVVFFANIFLSSQDISKIEEDLNIALEAYKNQDDIKALNYANKVLKKDKNNVKALFVRSKILFFKKNYKSSLLDINTALEEIERSNNINLQNFKIPFLRDRGVIYDYQGYYDKALQDFFEALTLSNDYPTTDFENAMMNFDIAVAYYNMKKFEDSYKYLEIALDFNPFELSYYGLGINLLKILKLETNLNYYYERGNVLNKYSNIIMSKIADKVFNMPNEIYQKLNGIEKYYELKFTKDGELQDPELFPVIKIGDILETNFFSDNFSEFMGNYMLVRKDFSKNKMKVIGLKIITFYEDSSYQDLHFIYKVKLEEVENN